ncbi:hypothetical protein [Arthrobacter terrae]|nr:hypothetical protein [Arthrobacter terrae]
MKILNINHRAVGQVEIALPFETDEQVGRAWEYLVACRHLADFSYRPDSEGEDEDRAFIASYLRRRHGGECMEGPESDEIRRIIPKIWQAELSFDIRELIGVEP